MIHESPENLPDDDNEFPEETKKEHLEEPFEPEKIEFEVAVEPNPVNQTHDSTGGVSTLEAEWPVDHKFIGDIKAQDQ